MIQPKKVFKLEIEYFDSQDLFELIRTVRGMRTFSSGSFTQGTAKAVITHYKVEANEPTGDEFETMENKPDRIEEINGKTHYIYKSKM